MIEFLFALLITICYLIGGQIEKGVRRYAVPALSVLFAYLEDKERSAKEKIRYFLFILMIAVLSLGYGENSWIRKLCKGNDGETRAIYSSLLVLIFSIVNWHGIILYFMILSVAFQIRAGSLGKIKNFDILIEDICRALAIFICTLISIKLKGV